MKYNISTYSDAEVTTTTVEKDISLSKDSQSIIFQMFSKNIYSNPIGSVVRELTSNCFDSHVEAGVKDMPVLIKKTIDNETDTHYISFIDFGVGMSPQRIDEVFSVMFSSTKRDSNDQIGAFGLGSKTPLAYKRSTGLGEGEYDNSYFIITVYNKIKYIYQVYEGNSSPRISLLHEEVTTEGNGTEIRIPVLKNDVVTFAREMERQLYYFENIVFEGFEDYDMVENDYQILQAKTFFFRGTAYESTMHVCLGRVAYPIDYSALGLNRYEYQIPIALKLNVGDIGVTVSRESLDYSEKTIKVLKEKLEEAKQEIVGMLSKQYDNIVTLEQYFEVKSNFGMLNLAGRNINLSNFIDKSKVNFKNFKYSDLGNIPNHKTLFNALFSYKRYGDKERAYHSTFAGGYDDLKKYMDRLYFVDGEFNRKLLKQSYLKSQHKNYFIITKKSLDLRHNLYTIASLFNKRTNDLVVVDEVTNEQTPTPMYHKLVELRNEYFEIVKAYAEDYDALQVPDDFVASRKREKLDANILKSSIPVKLIGSYSKTRVAVKDLVEFNRTIFYGTMEDEADLITAHRLYNSLFNSGDIVTNYGTYYGKTNPFNLTKKRGIMFVMVAKNNMKIFKHCKKAYHVSEFKHKMLYRKEDMIMKYYNVDALLEKYYDISELYKSTNFALINAQWSDFAQEIKQEINNIPKDLNLKYLRHELERFFDLSKAESVDKDLLEKVEKLKMLEEANYEILEYINMPYRYDYLAEKPALVEILKKVMVFDF
ncbi:MAG: hypothetical protein ACOC22_01415 [bacterium]